MTHHLFGDGNLDHVIGAQVAGYFRAEVELLSSVKVGQRLGTVQDFFGHPVQEVTASQAGLVIMLRRFHRVHVGDGLAQITSLVTNK
jgi:predicted deacylase